MTIPLGYRILELPLDSLDIKADGVEVGNYDSAYGALEVMKRAFFRCREEPPNWYLLAPNQQVLLTPADLREMSY